MKHLHLSLLWLAFAASVQSILTSQAANSVGAPNILWHNRATGQNRVWIMNNTSFSSEVALPSTAQDLGWKMVGAGDFDRDGNSDLVWQNENTGQNAVWFMKGTIQSSAGLIQSAGDLGWKIVGVADFDRDGKPDLLWQNLNTAQNAIWLMNGLNPVSFNLIFTNGDPNWRIVAVADLNADSKPDIILRNSSTGQNAIWYMNGLTLTSGDLLRMTGGTEASQADQDWRIVGAFDANGDGKPDLLWRHATLGISAYWFLNGGVVSSTAYFAKQDFNTDWVNASQDMPESRWRLQNASYTFLQGIVSGSPPSVSLNWKLAPATSFGMAIQRRLTTETNWTTLGSGLQSTNYTDTSVVSGRRYEYRAYREGFNGSIASAAEHFSVAVNASPLENRGRVILLVDKTLSAALASNLDQLKQDLIGDGWTVSSFDVPRHIDSYTPATAFRTNAYNITNVIKPLIRSAYTSDPTNTKAILLIGHVSIPYSGSFSVDGHTCGPAPLGPDHQGAWPADMYYGDLDGNWTDTVVNYTNCDFGEPTNIPGDGKFDQDGIPSPFLLKMAVGRVDFARLPVFSDSPPSGVAPRSELLLLQQYLNKNHSYRFKQLGWQSSSTTPKAQVYGHFHDSRDNPIFENAANAATGISTDAQALSVGDFCMQRTKPYLWGFLSGAGGVDRVNSALPVIEHTAADLAFPANEPSAAFYLVLASYTGDWNIVGNNYLRSLLTTANYGLASMWTRFSHWRMESMGLGEHLGTALQRMVLDSKDVFYEHSRELTILGDPTLRLHILAPPAGFTSTSSPNRVQLVWTATESGAQYYVYRAASMAGPFTRISNSPVNGTSFSDTSPSNRQKYYMVRGLKSVTVGTGTYTNISQGVFVKAN